MRLPRSIFDCVGRIELGPELGERRQLPELGEVALELSGDLLHGLELRRRPDAGDGDADGDRRSNTLVEEIRFEINLSVGLFGIRVEVGMSAARRRLEPY